MSENAKPLAWIHGEIKTPPFSKMPNYKRVFYEEGFKRVVLLRCRIPDQCHRSERIVTNYALTTKIERGELSIDRKSTRLNSSHVAKSYPVFCLNKKRTINTY